MSDDSQTQMVRAREMIEALPPETARLYTAIGIMAMRLDALEGIAGVALTVAIQADGRAPADDPLTCNTARLREMCEAYNAAWPGGWV
ncbi:MAG: hypothetical protein GY937_22810 [bacterium]|nr:hypothetical protein [bacterium]